jgi:hypothetical protein
VGQCSDSSPLVCQSRSGSGRSGGAAGRQLAGTLTTEELLGKAREEASVPRVLSPPTHAESGAPLSLDPEVTAVLEKELKRPGDVTTILEERDQFEVFRLTAITNESWKVETARFPKLNFDSWLESQTRRALRQSP